MKKFHPHESHAEHPNVVPLIDVFLCLIVFYMLAAKIGVTTGADETIKVPEAIGRQLELTGTLILNVKEVAGKPNVSAVDDGSSERKPFSTDGPYETSELTRFLERQVKRNPEMKLIIRGDGEITYKTFMPILLSVSHAKVKNVFHNAKKPEGK
jgi:biopolymer transport protein TolR